MNTRGDIEYHILQIKTNMVYLLLCYLIQNSPAISVSIAAACRYCLATVVAMPATIILMQGGRREHLFYTHFGLTWVGAVAVDFLLKHINSKEK